MLTIVFVVTVVTLIFAHHFLVARPREKRRWRGVERVAGQLSELAEWLPPELSLQPNLTWIRRAPGGEALLGVHPLLLGLIGTPQELNVMATGFVQAGDPLIRVRRDKRSLTLLSPIAGELWEAADRRRSADAPRSGTEGADWLCRIDSRSLPQAQASSLRGEAARAWLRDRYLEIRDFVQRLASEREFGPALADGGDLPLGVLSGLGASEWEEFERAFLRS